MFSPRSDAAGSRGGEGEASRSIASSETALQSPGQPLLVVNGSESEPASRKDQVLCSYRPHVVLEGAAAIAKALGAAQAVIHLHGSSIGTVTALRQALAERQSVGGDPLWRLSCGPGGYVAGESSAVAQFVHAGVARPSFSSTPWPAGAHRAARPWCRTLRRRLTSHASCVAVRNAGARPAQTRAQDLNS